MVILYSGFDVKGGKGAKTYFRLHTNFYSIYSCFHIYGKKASLWDACMCFLVTAIIVAIVASGCYLIE